ncbi:MAG: flagellin [Rubrivivax sp.]
MIQKGCPGLFSLNTNLMALTARRSWAAAEAGLAVTSLRLATGLRINSARDDPAGLVMSERLLAQIRGSDTAVRNANEAISRAQVGETATASVVTNLQRMRELAVQAANGSLTLSDRALLEVEFDQLQADVASVISGTRYNGAALLDNSNSLAIQVGPNPGQTVSLTHTNLKPLSVSVNALSLTDSTGDLAAAAQLALDDALTAAGGARAAWGATISRFDSVVSHLQDTSTALTVARGRIMDADFAAETAKQAKLLLQRDASIAMFTQANAQPRQVLSLLLG